MELPARSHPPVDCAPSETKASFSPCRKCSVSSEVTVALTLEPESSSHGKQNAANNVETRECVRRCMANEMGAPRSPWFFGRCCRATSLFFAQRDAGRQNRRRFQPLAVRASGRMTQPFEMELFI